MQRSLDPVLSALRTIGVAAGISACLVTTGLAAEPPGPADAGSGRGRTEIDGRNPMNQHDAIQAAADGIEQALIRFAAGQDGRDAELLGSAFSADAVLDFTHPAMVLGASASAMKGRAEIVETIRTVIAPLVTSHTISNVRVVQLSGDKATAQALIEAMHVDRANPDRRLLLKNQLDIAAERIGPHWQIASLTFRNLWREGEARVLFPATPGARPAMPDNPTLSVIIYRPGPQWKKGQPLATQGLAAHGRYLAGLARAGTILTAGPLATTEGGLVVVSGAPSEAEAIMASDPAVRDGKFVGTVSRWTPMMGWMSQRPFQEVGSR